MADDYYKTLSVKRDASEKEIRSAFRRLARQHHPDVNPGNADAEARFKAINAAYEVLSDPADRKKYDQYGDDWQHADQIEAMRRERGQSGGGFGGFGGRMGGQGGTGVEFDFGGGGRGGSGGNGGGGLFDGLFRRAAGRQRGADAEHQTRISLEDAYRGATRTIEVREGTEVCRVCSGQGSFAGATCHACRGTGSATPLRRIEVSIPAGIQTGQRVRIAGKGGPAGDLYLVVEVLPHPHFERRGDDLYVDADVPVADAALGGEVHVPTLKGRSLALRIPAGTQGGKVFRLAGQGMPRPPAEGNRSGGFGDLHARVRLVLPDPLTDDQRALFERLRATAEAPAADPAGEQTRSAR